MEYIIGHIKGRDGSRGLLLLAALAVGVSVWLLSADVLDRPSAHERQVVSERHEEAARQALGKPAGAEIPLTKPFVPDYTLPPVTDGLAPVITHIDTTQPVVFLTIDDGAYKDISVVAAMRAHHLKASLFLAKMFIAGNPDFFRQLTARGSVIENHTLSHDLKMVKSMNYEQQKAEICGMADYETQVYGHRPILYRPPGGAYSTVMRRAAHDCGMKALVTWTAKVDGGAVQYQVGDRLRPGDIVLLHFRREFQADLQAFVDAVKAAGLHTELLEDAIVMQ